MHAARSRLLALLKAVLLACCGLTFAPAAVAGAPALPPGFEQTFSHQRAEVNGVRLHYVVGGHGEPVVLLHGWAETWYSWHRIMPELARHYTVIVPDLRGLGDSARPATGYDDATLSDDVFALMAQLGVAQARVVGHDLGTQVAYALAARHPDAVSQLVLLDAPVPGIPPWDELTRNRRLWHWTFYQVPDLPEALIAGRERTYFSWFYRQIAVNMGSLDEDLDEIVRAYSEPGAVHAGLAYFRAFDESARQNAHYAEQPLRMPVLALGGAGGNGMLTYQQMKLAAVDVQGGVIDNCGHWIPTEQPQELLRRLLAFFNAAPRAR